jgi:hypothetical protein
MHIASEYDQGHINGGGRVKNVYAPDEILRRTQK